jgi:type I restriction enzyme S subunit
MREMKDSGIRWMGDIPSDWNVERVKHGFVRKKEEAHQENPIVLSLARAGVKARDISNNEGQIAESYYNYNPVDVDDLLINPMDLYSGANCSISKIKGVISPAYINLRYCEGHNPNYYDYYFKVQYWMMAFFAHGKGVSYENRWTLNAETLMNYPIIVPPFDEQCRIVKYLDLKCSQIDAIIEKQQTIIEKLKEYKLRLIQETVTKGLDENVELKESGEIWVGKVPKHWKVLKLKCHTRMITPMRDKPEDLNGDIPWVRIEDYNGKYIDSSREGFGVSEQTIKEMNLKVYPVGSILCTSSCDLGKCAIVATPLVSNQRFINIVPDEDTSSDYLYYVMTSNADRMNHLSTGTIQANLSRVAFEHLLIQFPPLEEQKEIASYLDYKVEIIDSSIMGKEKMVEKLREYKKTLIYEVVTGKKEV